MRKSRSVAVCTMVLAFLVAADARLAASAPQSRPSPARAAPAVTLRGVAGATIRFWTQNGETVDGVPPQARDLPHLVLNRNGTLTPPRERTLIVEVVGIQIPPGGVTVTVEVTTQHADPDSGANDGEPILVWLESRRIVHQASAQVGVTAIFSHTFGATAPSSAQPISTPTDYFRYTVTVADASGAEMEPARVLSSSHAFLMESEVVARQPEVQEESGAATPDEMVVYYCDMFPFQGIESDIRTRLPRMAVPRYVRSVLLPRMIDAFHSQTNEWGFSWNQEWTSFRFGEDSERLSVALTDGQTWYHGMAPAGGHAGISLNTYADDDRAPYDSLSDDLISTFHHELFHNLQRSLSQHLGGDGRVSGMNDAWAFFSEGTAYLVSSVGLPSTHSRLPSPPRHRMSKDHGQLTSDLSAYAAMPATLPILYWRFLYEQCGGMTGGVEDPGAGMAIVRNALWALYSGDIVDTEASTDLLGALPAVMGHALAETPSCPFHTFEESLLNFARALYSLRLDGGRCTEPGMPAGCGLYDPHSLYRAPSVRELVYHGGYEECRAHSWTSLDVDLLEVTLKPPTDGQSLELVLEPDVGGDAAFVMQLWRLSDEDPDTGLRPVPEETDGPEVVGAAGPGGRIRYVIPAIELTEFTRIGVIITRVDVDEGSDPVGKYTLRLTAG